LLRGTLPEPSKGQTVVEEGQLLSQLMADVVEEERQLEAMKSRGIVERGTVLGR